jgi:hypothetical protein
VATDLAGSGELIGFTGSVVKPADAIALAEACSDFMESSAARLAAGEAARKRIQSSCSLPWVAKRYEEFYARELRS